MRLLAHVAPQLLQVPGVDVAPVVLVEVGQGVVHGHLRAQQRGLQAEVQRGAGAFRGVAAVGDGVGAGGVGVCAGAAVRVVYGVLLLGGGEEEDAHAQRHHEESDGQEEADDVPPGQHGLPGREALLAEGSVCNNSGGK